jgi:hypothetical protein
VKTERRFSDFKIMKEFWHYIKCCFFHRKYWKRIDFKVRSPLYMTIYYKCGKCGEEQSGALIMKD